jgi:hypothetical protein
MGGMGNAVVVIDEAVAQFLRVSQNGNDVDVTPQKKSDSHYISKAV